MNAQIIEALQSYFKDLDREDYENSPEYLEQLYKEQGEASAPYVVPIPRKPTSPAIEVLKMTKEQKTAFVASIDRTLAVEGVHADLAMLKALRDAAMSELDTIDAQIKERSGKKANPIVSPKQALVTTDRGVLFKHVEDVVKGIGKSCTPSIPGANTPKRTSKRKS